MQKKCKNFRDFSALMAYIAGRPFFDKKSEIDEGGGTTEEQGRHRSSLIPSMPAFLLQVLCSSGGRRSMAAQRTHRELAPSYAAGKVPVPSGRECHWETRRPLPCSLQRSSRGVVVAGFGPLQQQRHAVSICKNAN